MISYLISCFLCSNVPDYKRHKQTWCMLFFTCIKLVVHVLACVCVCDCMHQMEKTECSAIFQTCTTVCFKLKNLI